MSIPKLKRIKVASVTDLRTWLTKNAGTAQEVMIVTCDKTSKTQQISSQDVRAAVTDLGWIAGQSFTLVGGLMGHVVRHP